MPADRLLHPRLGHSEKVTALSDLEFRVWVTYELAADDYGVMRMSAVTVQAADDALARRPAKAIDAALKRLVSIGLLRAFTHQGRVYAFQHDWQNHQRVKHPRDTMQPKPPDHELERCTPATRKLFTGHTSLKHADESPENGQSSSGDCPESGKPLGNEREADGSLACAGGRETANGQRLPANGSQGVQGDLPPMDIWARELINLAPPGGRCGWNLVERPLFSAIQDCMSNLGALDAAQAFAFIRERLENHKRSHQWRIKGMVKRLDRWLTDGLYLQELPEDAPLDERLSKSTSKTLAAAAEILKEPA